MPTNQINCTSSTNSQTKSPETIDFSSTGLLRGLSVFLDPFTSLEAKPEATNNLDLNNSEKTYDLSDYLIQHQKQSSAILTTLEPVRSTTPYEQKEAVIREHKPIIMASSLAVSECSMDSQGSFNSSFTSEKRKLDESVETKPSKRGRKPATALKEPGAVRSKFGKHELVTENNQTKTLVYFGNKRVEVGTDEYEKRRKSNNDAVKKCRQKMEKEQQERESKMKELMDENRRLSEKVNTMGKEMEVLKGIIISMKPDNKLPEFIQNSLNDL